MDTWIYKQTITMPTGSKLDEIECPRCGYRQTVPGRCRFISTVNRLVTLSRLEYNRPRSCYVCETELEPDDFLDDFFKDRPEADV